MVEYGMVLIVWLTENAFVLHDVGSNCDDILAKILKIVGQGHDFIILSCEPTRGA